MQKIFWTRQLTLSGERLQRLKPNGFVPNNGRAKAAAEYSLAASAHGSDLRLGASRQRIPQG